VIGRADVLAALAPGRSVEPLAGPRRQDLAIPRAIEDRDLTVAGDLEPEAMEPGILRLGGARRRDGVDAQAARVEAAHQDPDRAYLRGARPALEDDHHGDARLQQRLLHFEELSLQRGETTAVLLFLDPSVEVDLIQYDVSPLLPALKRCPAPRRRADD